MTYDISYGTLPAHVALVQFRNFEGLPYCTYGISTVHSEIRSRLVLSRSRQYSSTVLVGRLETSGPPSILRLLFLCEH